jgi:hypothetical protein
MCNLSGTLANPVEQEIRAKLDVLHIVSFYNPTFSYLENMLPEFQANAGKNVVVLAGLAPFPYHDKESRVKAVCKTNKARNGLLQIIPVKSWIWSRHPGVNICNILGQLSLRPKLVYIHGITSLNILYGVFFRICRGAKVIVDCHNDRSNQSASKTPVARKITLLIYGFCLKILLSGRLLSRVITIGQGSTDYCVQDLGISSKLIFQTKLGFDRRVFFENTKRAEQLLCAGKRKCLTIGLIGKITKEKNVCVLEGFLDILLSQGFDVSIDIAGFVDEETSHTLKNLKHKFKLMRWLGNLKACERKVFFDSVDFCVWMGRPSILIQECVGSGCPAIVSNHASTGDFVFADYAFDVDGNNEVFFQNLRDVGNFVNVLKKIFCFQKKYSPKYDWVSVEEELDAAFRQF